MAVLGILYLGWVALLSLFRDRVGAIVLLLGRRLSCHDADVEILAGKSCCGMLKESFQKRMVS